MSEGAEVTEQTLTKKLDEAMQELKEVQKEKRGYEEE